MCLYLSVNFIYYCKWHSNQKQAAAKTEKSLWWKGIYIWNQTGVATVCVGMLWQHLIKKFNNDDLGHKTVLVAKKISHHWGESEQAAHYQESLYIWLPFYKNNTIPYKLWIHDKKFYLSITHQKVHIQEK